MKNSSFSRPSSARPPHWPQRLLRLFLKKEYLEEIEGDMEEMFENWIEEHQSVRKARRLYAYQMLTLLRPALIKNLRAVHSINQYPMFKNYFKISFRSLMKNPLSSFINVFGLSVAIGISLVVYAFMEYDSSIDQFHQNKNEIYLTTYFTTLEGETQQYGNVPRPVGELLRQDFAQIKKVARIEDRVEVVKSEDNVFHEPVRYADPEFLEVFTFPLKWGSSKSLADLNSIILSEDMSKKYFGEENPIGRDVLLVLSDSVKKAFKVTGVAAAFPKSRDIEFNCLINFDNMVIAEPTYQSGNWSKMLSATFVQVENASDVKSIEQKMEKYKRLYNENNPERPVTSFTFESLVTLHQRAAGIRDGIVHDYNKEGRIGMPIIAIFMIILACFNYINIAIVSASRRLKEIGIRKTIGANRFKVIVQFLAENVVLSTFALLTGLALCIFLFIPWFVQFSGWDLEIKFQNINLWLFLLALMLFTSIASGIYPALYISSFDSVKIFRGSLQFGKKNPLMKVFLSVQLILACMTITAGVVFTQNNTFQRERSWGYDQKHAMFVKVPDQRAFDKLHAALLPRPGVLSISGSREHIGRPTSAALVKTSTNQEHEADLFAVDPLYFETMGLEFIEGSRFREDSESDKHSVIVNETFLKEMNILHPIGQQFEIDGVKYDVIGVLKDFHVKSFFNKLEPVVFKLAAKDDYRYLTLRFKEAGDVDTYDAVRAQWAKLYPEVPFQGGFQEELWTNFMHSVDRSETFNKVIASIAVLLASLGLYGLVTLNVSGRVKEFSIRKTLGAGLRHISAVIGKQYALLILISLVIGAPISYWFTAAYLDMLFAYPMPMTFSGIAISLLILLSVLALVIFSQVRKVLKLNPLDGLKVE